MFAKKVCKKLIGTLMRPNLEKIVPAKRLLLLMLVLPLTACSKSDKPLVRTFATPEEAGNALQSAAQSGDEAAVLRMFGPDAKELISSGDAVQDKDSVQAFVDRYAVMHRWRGMQDGAQVLLVGADNFPFPIPLKKDRSGQWFFDTAAGKEEVLNRRIGRNELAIIDVCRAAAAAQFEYFSHPHKGQTTKQYAMKFISSPGTQDGLYWKSEEGQPESPLGPLVAFATAEGYRAKPDAHVPFHGYYFHMLQGQGNNARGGAKNYVADGKMVRGFAFVAYPAEYGNSGVMTFMIDQDGVLIQKDLGASTAEKAAAMNLFDPDSSWSIVQD